MHFITVSNNLEQVIHTCAQANSAFYLFGVGKWAAISIW